MHIWLTASSSLPLVVSCFFIASFARPSRSSIRPLPINQLSPRSVSISGCGTWPGGVIPYCFEEDVGEKYQKLFKKGVAKWTDKDIPVIFTDGAVCPAADADNRGQVNDDFLSVGMNPESEDIKDTGAVPGFSTEWASFMLLPQACSPMFDDWCTDQLVIAIAQALGTSLCLEFEHRHATDKDLKFDFRNLADYHNTDDNRVKELILKAVDDPQIASDLKERGILGPAYYSRINTDAATTQVYASVDFDWQSIMLMDGSEYALKGSRVMFKANGHTIEVNTEPSARDIRMVRWLYRNYEKTSNLPSYTPYEDSPTYQEATSKESK